MSEKKAGNWKSGLKWFLINVAIAIIAMVVIRIVLITSGLHESERTFFKALQFIFAIFIFIACASFIILSMLRLLSKKQRIKKRKAWFINIQAILLIFASGIIVAPEPTPSERAAMEAERVINQRIKAHQKIGKTLDQEYGKGFLVRKPDFLNDWPFKNAELATIRCTSSSSNERNVTIQFDQDSRIYALNRSARNSKLFPELEDHVNLKTGKSYENAIPSKWISDGEDICWDRLKKSEELAEKQFRKCLSTWDGSVFQVIERVKRQMHDPKSFEHVSTTPGFFENSTGSVIMRFRGKNAFGGTVLQTVIAHVEPNSCDAVSVKWIK